MKNHSSSVPEINEDPDWERLEAPRSVGEGRSFVSGDPDGDRLRVRYFRDRQRNMFIARAWFGPGTEGPPGHAHGGSIFAVMDEVMGGAVWLSGHTAATVSMSIRFRNLLPLGTCATVEGWVEEVKRKKITARSRIFDPGSGRVFAESEGTFLETKDVFRKIRDIKV
jgi:acyl-coenzyme A thioesterase PaaI-like protein